MRKMVFMKYKYIANALVFAVIFMLTAAHSSLEIVKANQTVSADEIDDLLELTVYADYRKDVDGQDHAAAKDMVAVYITARTKGSNFLEEESVQLLKKLSDDTYEDVTNILVIRLSEQRNILVATMLLYENGDYLVNVTDSEKNKKSQTIKIQLREKESEMESVHVREEQAQTALKKEQTEKKQTKQNEKTIEISDITQSEADKKESIAEEENEVRIIEAKEAKTAVIQKSDENDRNEKKALLPAEAFGELKESVVRNEKEQQLTGAEKNVEIKKPVKTVKDSKEEIKKEKQKQMLKVVKTGVPISALILLAAALILLWRRKDIVVIFASDKNKKEKKLGEVRLEKRESKHVLFIPTELLFTKESAEYQIKVSKLFNLLHKEEKLYISCMEKSYETQIQRQISFSV